MIKTLIHTSEKNNHYIYDDQHRLSMLIHPELMKVHEKSADIDPYYLDKYEYLKKHDLFIEPRLVDIGTLDELMVEEGIIRTQQIVFEVTDNCNLNCTYCSEGELYREFYSRNNKKINNQYAINLLKYILTLKQKRKYNKLKIGFYGGEPLLNIKFIKQIVEFVKQWNPENKMEILYNITTNATLIHKHIQFLSENNFQLLVSLDGNEKNNSYRIFKNRNTNSFSKVVDNLDMIKRDYPDYFISNINFNTVLHDRNSVKDIYEFIFIRYNKIPRISELSSDNTNPDKKNIYNGIFHRKRKSEEEYQKEKSNLLPINETLTFLETSDFLKYISINYYMSNLTSILQNSMDKYFPTSTCIPFNKKIFLTVHNKLIPCEKINQKYSMGEANQNVLFDISEITRQYNFYYNHIKKECQKCYAYKFCGLCLFHINNLDKVDTEEFTCNRFYDKKGFQNKLYRLFSFLEKSPESFFQILENIIIEE